MSPVPLDSKESRDPHTVKMSIWLRATSLHSIMIEHKMSDYEQQIWDFSLGVALESRRNLITAVMKMWG